jgi:hypothetical protein
VGFLCNLSAIVYLAAISARAQDGGFAPTEALQRMVVPEGFRVELVASEPEIRQPVAATFDERGRMWVVEYLQYPTPAGVKAVTVDQYLRTEYDTAGPASARTQGCRPHQSPRRHRWRWQGGQVRDIC